MKIHKPADMKMVGTLTREVKGKYILDLKFRHSLRYYGWEIIPAVNKREARAYAKKFFPNVEVKK